MYIKFIFYIPLILDKAGQSVSSWNGIFSILICCWRNSRSLCSCSSPPSDKVKESLTSDKCKLPPESEEDSEPVLLLLLPVMIKEAGLSSLVFLMFLLVVWLWSLLATKLLLLEVCDLPLLGFLACWESSLVFLTFLFAVLPWSLLATKLS